MNYTNYHLFDFMDFDPTLAKPEYLWKAYAPSKMEERDGDIVITIPYQRQKRQEDMAPDETMPQQSFDLIVRAYEPGILRLFTSMEKGSAGDPPAGVAGEDAFAPTDSSPMLQFSPEVKRLPLTLVGCDIVTANGTKMATIDLNPPTLDHWSDLLPPPQPAPFITFYPDGDLSKPIALSDDHFSPPRYDALPLGFVTNGALASSALGGIPAEDITASETAEATGTSETTETTETAERATISFRCTPDECFVGTGERFRKMDLSGQTFFLKNQDGQGVNNRRCYKNIPFYLSSRMYGAFFHTSDYCKLSLADQSTRSVQFLNAHATIDVFLIGGDTPETILRRYRMLTGFPQMPPLWSFGIWMSRMTYFSAQEVEEICQRLREEHYPCDVIHLDTGWFRTDWLCEWKFNPERFPDPEGFIRRLADKGFKVSLWQLPYIAQGAEQLEEAKRNGYISRKASPSPSEGGDVKSLNCAESNQTSPPLEGLGEASNFSALDYAGTIDFTYDKATDWYKNKLLKPLLDMGVKCIKTDFGENIHTDHCYHNGMPPERLNNLYALLYQKAAWESAEKDGDKTIYSPLFGRGVGGEAAGATESSLIWARAAWTGCQRYPVHWGGDSESSWSGMAGSLKGGLHLGLSGFAFWSHDVPGFHSTPDFMNSPLDPRVYVRWTQFGVFTSHIRYHGTCKREPWHYQDIAPIVKRWWKLRYRLIPYIIQESQKACASGLPILQALLIKHPHDRQVWHIDDEYYFGDDFLVAPVMNSEDRRDIYLPEAPLSPPEGGTIAPATITIEALSGAVGGAWINFFTGKRYEGGRWYYGVETPLNLMPVFVREGARIPLYPDDVDSTDDMDLSRTIILEINNRFKGIEW